ncbi:MAG: hypothetical protein ABI186_11235 [Candidatus Elarobacter sp.]
MNGAHPSAALAALVIVVVNGAVTPTTPAATVRDGRVVGPLNLVARFADRVDTTDGGTVTVARGARTCTARPIGTDDPPLVLLAPLARCLGGEVAWDGRTKTLALAFGGETVLRTLAPYDPKAPRVAPTTVFTPEPAPPTPRAIDTGAPRPRRTAIPVIPSWPLLPSTPPSTAGASISPRP